MLVVEHDEAMMRGGRPADRHGPRRRIARRQNRRSRHAGRGGSANPDSVTGRYLSGELAIALPERRRRVAKTRSLAIEGVTTNNLKDVNARIPLSRAGVHDRRERIGQKLAGERDAGPSAGAGDWAARPPSRGRIVACAACSQIDKMIKIDQSPIGRTRRSNPATYTGVFDEIRKVFRRHARSPSARLQAGRFSFNVKGGRCEECQGQGVRQIEMNFLPDLTVPCPVCGGARFNRQTLEVHYRGRSIAEVLDMHDRRGDRVLRELSARSCDRWPVCRKSGWAI